jgi:hypothetical protein
MLARGPALLHRSARSAQADLHVLRGQRSAVAVYRNLQSSKVAPAATMLRQRHTASQAASAVAPAGPTQAILEAETEVTPK